MAARKAKKTAKTSSARSTRKTTASSRPGRKPGDRTFYFGAQYFRAPTPDPQDWQRDFNNMKKCNMNIIRMWVLWNWHEPAEGQYDWEDIDALIQLCRKNDMKLILLLSLESTPAWLNKRHPEAVYEGHDGTKQHPDGFGNHPGGLFPGLNLDYPDVRDAAEHFIRAVVRRYKNDTDVIWGWEPHNEPIIEPARMKFSDEQVYSYNTPSIEHFRKWLKDRYNGDLAKLNHTWSRKYSHWDEIEPTRRIPGGTAADFLDWTLHNTTALTQRVQWRCDVMRDEDPHIHLMLHTRAYGGMQGNAATWGMDDWQLAELPDTWGGSSFYRQWPDAGYFLNNDNLYATAKGKEFWLSEVQGGPPGGGLARPGGTDPDKLDYTPRHMEMWTLMPISQGAKGFMYWQFRMERKGPEYGFGVTNIDGSWSEYCDVARNCGAFIQKNADLFLDSEVMPYEVAVGYSMPTNMLEMLHRNGTNFSTESIMGAYKLALHQDLPCYIVRLDEEAVDDDYSPFKVIMLPYATWISPRSVEKLKAWVAAGGTVIADAGLGEFTNDRCWWSQVVPGSGLDEVFGVQRHDVRTVEKVGKKYTETQYPCTHTILGREFSSAWLMEKLRARKGSSPAVLGEWPDGTPAVTVNEFGKGRAVYIGSSAFYAYSNNEASPLLELFRGFTQNAARHAWTDRIETHVRVLKAGQQRIYFVFNYSGQSLATWATFPGCKDELWDLRAERPIPTETCPDTGHAALRLSMQPFETRIFTATRP